MRSDAATVDGYLESMPEDRREAILEVREVVLANLPDGYEEAMNWGMITYQVPLKTYPDTYNKEPLMYAALASQKNHMAVYLTGVYTSDGDRTAFEEEYRATGKRLDMGKSCVRFRRIDDLPLDVIGRAIAAHSVESFIELVETARSAKRTKG